MKKDFQKLYAEQDIILDLLVRNGIDLVLSGGTALHRFHLKEKYRYSEDLDFFTQTDMKECMEFIEAIKQNKIPYKITNNTETLKQLIVFDNLKIELMQDVSYNKPSPVKTQKAFWLIVLRLSYQTSLNVSIIEMNQEICLIFIVLSIFLMQT